MNAALVLKVFCMSDRMLFFNTFANVKSCGRLILVSVPSLTQYSFQSLLFDQKRVSILAVLPTQRVNGLKLVA